MKNFFYFCMFVVICVIPSSCQKDEMLSPADISNIKAQLVSVPDLTKEEVQNFLSGGLKSAQIEDDDVMVMLLPLDISTTYVSDGTAIKYFIYYEINLSGHRQKVFTISQIFVVKDGKVDLSNYSLKKQIGCPFNRSFSLDSPDNVSQINYFFHFKDGRELMYVGEQNNGYNVLLPPIADGQWQLSVSYFDGDMSQECNSELVNFNDDIIKLKINIKESNILSYLKIDRNMFNGVYMCLIVGQDTETSDHKFMSYKPIYDDNLDLSNVMIPTSFKIIKYIRLYYMNGYVEHYNTVVDVNSPTEGPVNYKLKTE